MWATTSPSSPTSSSPSMDELLSTNLEALLDCAQFFLDRILSSVDQCPVLIKNICYLLTSEIQTKFPNAHHIVIGGFVFLRSLTPVVVAPEGFQIMEEDLTHRMTPRERRALVLISKLLQNASNGKEFKEPHMIPCNDFVAYNHPRITLFFDQLSECLSIMTESNHTTATVSSILSSFHHSDDQQQQQQPLPSSSSSSSSSSLPISSLSKWYELFQVSLCKMVKDLSPPHSSSSSSSSMSSSFPVDSLLKAMSCKQHIEEVEKKKHLKRSKSLGRSMEKSPSIDSPSPLLPSPPPAALTAEEIKSMIAAQNSRGGQPLSSSLAGLPEIADYTEQDLSRAVRQVFGSPLALAELDQQYGIPVVLDQMLTYLDQHGLSEEGILRLAGSGRQAKQLRDEYELGHHPDLTSYDIHSIASLTKTFLRELPKPPLLLTVGLQQFDSMNAEHSEKILHIQKEFEMIPELNYNVLSRLFIFLSHVAQHSERNKMTPSNVGIVFQPTLQLPLSLIIFLIENASEVFMQQQEQQEGEL